MSDSNVLNANAASDSYEDSQLLTLYLKEISRIPLLTEEQEQDLAARAKAGEEFAMHKLVESNLRFVVNIAKKYQGAGLSLVDLIQEGSIGLMTAAKKFEPERGYHFISYAVWWIRQAIVKAVNEKGRAVRLPMNRVGQLEQINKAEKHMLAANGDAPSDEDLAQSTGIDVQDVKDLRFISRDMVSLDAPVVTDKGGGQNVVGDFVPDETASPEEGLVENSMKEKINEVLSTLNDKERDIVENRFGLNGHEAQSLKQIGERYGLTKERIRQIEKKALEKMRSKENLAKLDGYIA